MLPGGTQLSVAEMSHRVFHRSVAHIGRQAASALAHAHARGVIHRDIKPSNLLLDTDGVVWVTDFGLAKAEDDGLTQTGDVLGTIRYMAPERFRGQADRAVRRLCARTDALRASCPPPGVRLAQPPGPDRSGQERRSAATAFDRPADPPRSRNDRARRPSRRTRKRDMRRPTRSSEDLRRFLADEPIQARQISNAERYWRWARRNPVVAVLGGVVTALLVAVTIGSMVAAAYFKESARREANLAVREQFANQRSQRDRQDAIEARRLAIEERDKSRQQSAELALDKGFALAEEGHADRGLFWMLEALKAAPDEAAGFRSMVRWNLGAWLGQVHKPFAIIGQGGARGWLAFSPDGKTFATCNLYAEDHAVETPIELWDTASRRKLRTLPGAFAPFAFRPDGQLLAAFAHDQRRVLAVDLATGRVVWAAPHLLPDLKLDIAFSRDGSTIVLARVDKARRGRLFRLDAGTGRQIPDLPQQRGAMESIGGLDLAGDGKTVATGRIQNGVAYIDVRDLSSGRRISSWPTSGTGVERLLFSPDGDSLFGSVVTGDVFKGSSFFGQIWATGTGRPASPVMAGTGTAIYAPGADRLLTRTGSQWFVRDATDGRVRGSAIPADGYIAAHPDGRTIIAASTDDTIRLWQTSADAESMVDVKSDKQSSIVSVLPHHQSRGFSVFWGGCGVTAGWPSRWRTMRSDENGSDCPIPQPAAPREGPCPITPVGSSARSPSAQTGD